MYKNYAIEEVTKANESEYLDNIAQLEIDVLNNMIQQGKEGQLFITGKEDIHEYVESENNHVVVAYRENKEKNSKDVIAATYITEGQTPFTYNDLTKYFKSGKDYKNYIEEKYGNNVDYKNEVKRNYLRKIIAFRTVRDLCLNKFLGENEYANIQNNSIEKNNKLKELIMAEHNDPENRFHEKSQLREYFNKKMSSYMKSIFENKEQYNDFYWINSKELCDILGVTKNFDGDENLESDISTYDETLEHLKYTIYEQSKDIEMTKYFDANTSNTVELDTYITSPFERENGLARILVFEGLKIALQSQMENKEDKNTYLVSTLHRDNMSSKYVSEFFGLTDFLYVNRRNGRDRELHILKLDKEAIPQYLDNIEKKIAVLYDYNPKNIRISDDEKKEIYKEQLEYEQNEMVRLNGIKGKYPEYEARKAEKIQELSERIDEMDMGVEK